MTDLTPLEPGTRVEWGKHDVRYVGTVIGQSEDPRDDGWYRVAEDQGDPSDNIRRWLLPLDAFRPISESATPADAEIRWSSRSLAYVIAAVDAPEDARPLFDRCDADLRCMAQYAMRQGVQITKVTPRPDAEIAEWLRTDLAVALRRAIAHGPAGVEVFARVAERLARDARKGMTGV